MIIIFGEEILSVGIQTLILAHIIILTPPIFEYFIFLSFLLLRDLQLVHV